MEQETSVARIPMRDGVNLAADVYLPARKEGERVPAVITRTPYLRNWTAIQRRAQSFCEAGFAFVAVDCRGRGDSDGVFFPYRDDGEDGYDTIEWVGSQPWCTGNVGTIGGSYSGRIQWLAALQKPPSLKAMIISVTPSDPFVEWPTGIPSPFHLCWLYMTWGKDMQSVDHIPWNDIYSHLPLVDASSLITDKDVKMWKVEMEHNEGRDDWWRKICYQHRFKEIDIPIFHISGWYDDELVGTPLNFIGMKREGPVTARDKQKLLVGPWPHSVNSSTRFGPLDFGEDSVIQIEKPYFKWFGKFLRGEENDILDNPVEVFLMGTNKWVKAKDFPLPGTDNQKWYFHSTQGAVTSKGDGSLSTSLPTEKERATDEYDYNPMDPFPYISEPTSAQIGGPDDYATLEEQRADNLVFTSAPLSQPLEVVGELIVTLFASSSAKDTDFTAKLLDLHPSGFSQRINDGMVRARFREDVEKSKLSLIEPGKVYEYKIHCWFTGHVFLPGHRIRVDIASSAFPKYDRNLNTGAPLGMTSESIIAHQVIYHSVQYPSHITLPVSFGSASAQIKYDARPDASSKDDYEDI